MAVVVAKKTISKKKKQGIDSHDLCNFVNGGASASVGKSENQGKRHAAPEPHRHQLVKVGILVD